MGYMHVLRGRKNKELLMSPPMMNQNIQTTTSAHPAIVKGTPPNLMLIVLTYSVGLKHTQCTLFKK